MARKITRKNFYMEIRRNFDRFISILFIVALGVALREMRILMNRI